VPRPISCYDKARQEHTFYLIIEDQGFAEPYDFTVIVRPTEAWPPPPIDPYYEVSVKRISGQLQTINMDNHDHAELRGKGITEAVLVMACKLLREDIVSSPQYRDNSDRRSPHATKVWERLVTAGVAIREGDRYRLRYDLVKDVVWSGSAASPPPAGGPPGGTGSPPPMSLV
jgi:hypothetical protein